MPAWCPWPNREYLSSEKLGWLLYFRPASWMKLAMKIWTSRYLPCGGKYLTMPFVGKWMANNEHTIPQRWECYDLVCCAVPLCLSVSFPLQAGVGFQIQGRCASTTTILTNPHKISLRSGNVSIYLYYLSKVLCPVPCLWPWKVQKQKCQWLSFRLLIRSHLVE